MKRSGSSSKEVREQVPDIAAVTLPGVQPDSRPPQKLALVINPASANGRTGRHWPQLARDLTAAGFDFAWTMTTAPGEGSALARRYFEDGVELVFSVGGDGTFNEVVNGYLAAGKQRLPGAALGIIPAGTGRDLARSLKLPARPLDAFTHALQCPARSVDAARVTYINHLGCEESRFFVNVAGLGLDGDTVRRVNQASKAGGGFFSFLRGTLLSLFLYRNQSAVIKVDGKLIYSGLLTVVVLANGIYFGGGMRIAPRACLRDGLLDIVILGDLSKCQLLGNLPRVYRGTHLTHPRVISLQGKQVSVEPRYESMLVNLDGEQPGRGPMQAEILPGALLLRA